jgi:integrase/recombinase XerD
LGERLLCTEEVRGSNPLSSIATQSQKFTKFTESLLHKFIASRPQGISQRSIQSYHYTLDNLVGYPLTSEGINTYLASLTCKNGKAKFYSNIRALSRWLFHNGYIPENVIERVSCPKIQRKLLAAVSKEQLDTLMAHCHCERDKALLSFLWYSGVRLSEAVNVKATDFDFREGTVVILGKGNKYRKALAGNGLVREWFSSHDAFEMSRSGVATMLKRLAKETGIQCNAHSFRRGFAVHQVKSGLSTRIVQALGGWESITMVERYSRSLTFDDALAVYRNSNNGEVFHT